MPSATRFLQSSSAELPASADPPVNLTMDSDAVVVLASLLCTLICVVGLALLARCAWRRRSSSAVAATMPPSPQTTSRGMKKKELNSLPKQPFDAAGAAEEGKLTDCVICLSEFEDGELVRVLPQCGHSFHVGCIDTWLGAHSSCPSCRRVLVVPAAPTCQKCGASAAAARAYVGGSG